MTEPTTPDLDPAPPAGPGHNNPPETMPYDEAALAALSKRVAEFVRVSNLWVRVSIDSEERAQKLADQINGLRSLFKVTDEARKKEKQPHDDAGQKVQAAFLPLLALLKKSADALKPKLADYVEAKEKAAAAEKERKLAEARAAEEAAKLAAMDAASTGHIEAQIAAEDAAKLAAQVKKEAARKVETKVSSYSGGGRALSMRKRRVCTMEKQSALYLHYRDNPKVAELLLSLANAEANSAGFPEDGKIPGVTISIATSVA